MSILSREVQPLNALEPISLIESGISMLLIEWQFSKAQDPIVVTEFGISTLSREAQSLKAPSLIAIVPFNTFKCVSFISPLNSNAILFM